MRESPVAREKIAVDQARRRPCCSRSRTRQSIGGSPAGTVCAWRGRGALLRSARPLRGRFHAMPNIKQQEKRVLLAARQRLENLRYRSTVKTLTRRLESAV